MVRKIIVNDLNKICTFVVLYYKLFIFNFSFLDATDRGEDVLVEVFVGNARVGDA